jgi:hypothetical protein
MDKAKKTKRIVNLINYLQIAGMLKVSSVTSTPLPHAELLVKCKDTLTSYLMAISCETGTMIFTDDISSTSTTDKMAGRF